MNAIVGMTEIASGHLNNPDKVKDCLKKIDLSSKLYRQGIGGWKHTCSG